MDIILYLLHLIQYQHNQICWLLNFICRYIPLRQWAFDDSHSPRYQKFKIDQLPVIKTFYKQDWQFLLEYYQWKYKKTLRPVQRRNGKSIPEDIVCPVCGAPHHFIYDNNGGNGQYQCKVCGQTFTSGESATTPVKLMCPHCGHALVPKKDRKFFRIHQCVNPKCSHYLHQLSKVDPKDLSENYGKNKYKLHYIYREFTVDFFAMDLNSLPKNASALRFSKHNAYIMSLCLTMHVNLGLSLRKTSQDSKTFITSVSHTNRSLTIVKLPLSVLSPLLIITTISLAVSLPPMKPISKSVVSKLTSGSSWMPQKDNFQFNITQVIGLTNEDEVSKEFRPYKQMIERLNRTYKASYRPTNGFDNYDGASYDLALWVAYYNFLRPHKHNHYQVLNKVDMLNGADNMPGKWQLLIFLGQKTIQKLQAEGSNCS